MTRMPSAVSWSVGLLLGWAALACTPGGVGDPCTPEDEYSQNFNGFQVTEVNVESRSFQCETRLCLVNHFQGRVSCRLGQTASQASPDEVDETGTPTGRPNPRYNPVCAIPGTEATNDPNSLDNIKVEVPPQLKSRQTEKAVYCSCRCDGPEKNARYCECPEGFTCEPLVDDLKITAGGGQLAGSYCIRSGTKYNEKDHYKTAPNCASDPAACGCTPDDWSPECGRRPGG